MYDDESVGHADEDATIGIGVLIVGTLCAAAVALVAIAFALRYVVA